MSDLDPSNYGNPAAGVADPEALAQELLARLADPEGLALYRKIASRFSEGYIRAALERALAMPADRVRVNRAALFNWLIHHGFDPENKQDPRA